MKSVIVYSNSNSTGESDKNGKVEKIGGKRIGYNYIILKSLKESKKNDVIKCFYIKSLTDFGVCVIKEGTQGDLMDKYGRDIKDRLLWQMHLHSELQDKVRIPRLLGSFEEHGNFYLVLERIKGKSLHKFCRDNIKELRTSLTSGNKLGNTALDYLIQIITLLSDLHKHQIVHRDVTATNFIIMPNGKVAVIDMELSYSLDQKKPYPPFQLGTFGYMSPQQEACEQPTISDDVFSVGAILLQTWTGVSAIKLTNGPIAQLCEKAHFFVPDKQFADIIIKCLQPDPKNRPSLEYVKDVIINYKNDLKQKKLRDVSLRRTFDKEDITNTIQQAIQTLASPLLVDAQKGWFSENRNEVPDGEKGKINKSYYASFNVGVSGVLYMMSELHRLGFDISNNAQYIEKALFLVKEKYIDSAKNQPGLHFGSDGIAVCLCKAIEAGLIPLNQEYKTWINKLLENDSQGLDLMNGIAGQGIANMMCSSIVSSQQLDDRIHNYAQLLMNSQQENGSWVYGIKNKKIIIKSGFAYGVAGIVYFLLEYGHIYKDKQSLNSAIRGIQWLIKKALNKKDTINWLSSSGKELSEGWSTGTPGIVLTFLKAYSVLGDSDYKRYIYGGLNSSFKSIDNNLSQSHGLSGLAEVYLEAYTVLNDESLLKRAEDILQTVMHLKKQHPKHGPYWLVEQEGQPVPGFMTGNSGILHLLLRYCNYKEVSFPMLPNWVSNNYTRNANRNKIVVSCSE